jgi:hypothetical protein
MIVSTVVSAIAFSTIIIVAMVIANQTTTAKTELEGKIRNVVDQVNTAQQYTYEFDKRQQQQVSGLERNVDDVRNSYITKTDAANSLTTQQMNANNINSSQVKLSGDKWNTGAVQFNSGITGASASSDYVIQRGADPKNPLSKNQLVIKTPAEKGSSLNIMSSDGISRMNVDSTTGQVTVPANVKTSTLQLGDKFKFSGVGDVQGDDNWLRMMDKDGKDYYGGIAAANIYARDNTYLNGQTYSSGPVKLRHNMQDWTNQSALTSWTPDGSKAGPSFGGPNYWSHFPWFDGNTYIRPGKAGGDINIDNANVARLSGNRVELNGPVFTPGGINVQNGDPGPLVEKRYSWSDYGDRYGVGQFPKGQTKMYTATNYPGNVSMSLAKKDGNFDDIITVNPDRSTNINGPLKMRHNWKDWTDNSAITTWTPDSSKAGPSFGGPNNWSHFPWFDGNTYIRPGKSSGDINIDNANNITLGANNIRANGNIGTPNGHLIYNDGRQHISTGELLYLLPNKGVVIGKEWGGTGSLSVQGDTNLGANVNVGNALKLRHNMQDWTNNAALTAWTPDSSKAGPSFGGPDNWSHFPWFDGSTYIRPGKTNANILIGDTSTGSVQLGGATGKTEVRLGPATHLPYLDGNAYIRPGRDGLNINVGDAWANEVNLGRTDGSGAVYSRSTKNYVKQGIDAWDNKWDNTNKTLFTGWNSDKVILGNNKSAGEAYLKTLPPNTVASANNMYVNGKLSTTNELCINDTCLNEGNLKVLKSWL